MTPQTSPPNERRAQLARSGILLLVLVAISYSTGISQMVGPFTATCALLAILPMAPFSKPKTILVSHLICVGVGLALTEAPIHPLLATFLGAWVAIMAMAIFRVVHAPAVAHTAIILLAKPPLGLFAAVVLGTAALFTLISYLNTRTGSNPVPAASTKSP